MDGLARIAMATRGRYLVLASSGEALATVLERMAASSRSGIRDSELGSRDSEFGTRDSGSGIQNSDFGTQDSGFRIRNPESSSQASGRLVGLTEPQTRNPEPQLSYAAGFRHAQERENFYRLTRLIDNVNRQPGPAGSQPQFFSDNIGSLSRTLARIQSVSIVVRDAGVSQSQTVVYDLAP
jgi:hypothetical protein